MMKAMNKVAFASAAAIAAIGLASVAMAQIQHSHVLSLRLPDGVQEQIRYVGDVAPVIRLEPSDEAAVALPAADLFGVESSFAALERLSARMDQEAAAMMQAAQRSPALRADGPDGMTWVDLGSLPPGMRGYTVVSTMSGGHVCTRTTQYGSVEGAGPARMVTRVSGDCGEVARSQASPAVREGAPAAPDRPMLQKVSARF